MSRPHSSFVVSTSQKQPLIIVSRIAPHYMPAPLLFAVATKQTETSFKLAEMPILSLVKSTVGTSIPDPMTIKHQ
uniref:Uncharacterized protein n=1 Tax=Romanomermis culicivorax TaxID=13658 RepID=A0A915KJ34_ROMCU